MEIFFAFYIPALILVLSQTDFLEITRDAATGVAPIIVEDNGKNCVRYGEF